MSAEEERTYEVDLLTRVEGEGRFRLRVKDGGVIEAELAIFEAPRFFEAFLRGRSPDEAIDLVARICGICPVAYQVSASRAFERAFHIAPSAPRLRRLMYCGEWIESHALHVFLLHAPDYLGYPGAIDLAKDHRSLVESGLLLKKTGDRIIEVLGGRATHPVSPCIGGFTKVPTKSALRALVPMLEKALAVALDTVRWTAALETPELDQEYVYVSLAGVDEYPIEAGETIAVSGRGEVPLDAWGDTIIERQVPHSNALQARLADGSTVLCGPLARLHHHAHRLHPIAAEAMRDVGLPRTVRNIYRSIVVRAVEIVHALAEAIDLIAAYEPPEVPFTPSTPRASIGCGASEAPRGLLWHRYVVGEDGLIAEARIVPPTSQNQARIEADLVGLAPALLALDHEAATRRCEQLIRAYDPCISCATHFLDLRIDREGA